jgi:signal peptidase I
LGRAANETTVLTPNVRWRPAARIAWQLALLLLIAVVVLGLRPGQVSGLSMEPRIDSDEYVLINALAYRWGTPRRGEIVAFRHERSAPTVYLKRVIGVPGDRVAIERGIVSVNGTVLDEPYVRFRDTRSFSQAVVPPEAYYVLGDNRANSDDSRRWGFVRSSDIVGRAVLGFWPPSHAGLLR